MSSSAPELGGYEYSNARVRGKMGRLLGSAYIESLLFKDIPEILVELQKTQYGAGISGAVVADLTLAGFDDALRLNLTEDLAAVRSYFGGEGRELIEAVLGSWDAHNVKTVIRGKSVSVTEQEIISALLPIGRLGDEETRELVHQPDIKNVIDLLVTWRDPYGYVMNRKRDLYRSSGDISVFETAIDDHYFESARQAASGGGSQAAAALLFIGMKIDIANVTTLLKSLRERFSNNVLEPLLFPGGAHLNLDWLLRQNAAGDLPATIAELKKTRYSFTLRDVGSEAEGNPLLAVESAMERNLIRTMIRLKTGDPFSIAPALSYVHAKVNEVTNLRILLHGCAFGLPPGRIERELFLV